MKAVLLMAYGTPDSIDEVEDYYTHIRGGRKPTDEQLQDLISRYKAIGGKSPLIDITIRQASKLQLALNKVGSSTRVYYAMKHSRPFIADVITNMKMDGVNDILSIVLAPHYSKVSTEGYINAVSQAMSQNGDFANIVFVRSWHDKPELIDAWVDRIKYAEKHFEGRYWLVFTAHSIPKRSILQGDPYRDQFVETAELISNKLGKVNWSFAFQSASNTGEPWLGPDLIEHLDELWVKGERNFLLAPIGFVSDHLEVLYDIDVECVEWSKKRGAELIRCGSLNDSDSFINCLLSIVAEYSFL